MSLQITSPLLWWPVPNFDKGQPKRTSALTLISCSWNKLLSTQPGDAKNLTLLRLLLISEVQELIDNVFYPPAFCMTEYKSPSVLDSYIALASCFWIISVTWIILPANYLSTCFGESQPMNGTRIGPRKKNF